MRCRLQVEVEVPLDRIPLYVRPGAVIELLPPDVNTLLAAPQVGPLSLTRRRSLAHSLSHTHSTHQVLGGRLDAAAVPLGAERVLQVWPGGSGGTGSGRGGSGPRQQGQRRVHRAAEAGASSLCACGVAPRVLCRHSLSSTLTTSAC
jgi:hypothetical protein